MGVGVGGLLCCVADTYDICLAAMMHDTRGLEPSMG